MNSDRHPEKMRVAVTGATGFVGNAVTRQLFNRGFSPVCILRSSSEVLSSEYASYECGDMGPDTDFRSVLKSVHMLVHCAARVHVMDETALDPLSEFRHTNVDATLNLARQCAEMGVKRFIFISSIKVNGESTFIGRPFHADDVPAPIDFYGISKREAEDGLLSIAAETGMEVVIIRPVLVYGSGVKANFLSMMRWLDRGVFLPLGAIHNKRSFVSIVNLCDFICVCLTHPAAANQKFLVSDGEDLSTTELLNKMGDALDRKAKLFRVPTKLLVLILRPLGFGAQLQRLCGNLQVDIRKNKDLLHWVPPQSVEQGLMGAAKYYSENKKI